ncbi:MAG: NosD domain-containing protein [Candidatus Bathyarchaeia archaeon]|nr:NosD domain-containing protein [Candidatus Bathyarchaeia archaeon]
MKRKITLGILLTLLLTSIATLAFNVQPVESEWTGKTVYIRADGSVDPPDAPIKTYDKVTYTLTGNIFSSGDGIVVEKDNIIIDGARYAVERTGAYFYEYKGVDLTGRSNVTIKNMRISTFYYGICLAHSSSNIISGNNITANNYDGISLYYSSKNIISGNDITANNDDGIYLGFSSNNSISGNDITANNDDGIWLLSSSNNSISGNDITANNDDGIWLWRSSSNVIYHNNFIDNTQQVDSDGSANVWDDGYPFGGNYWSDYAGVDLHSGPYQNETGSDGIWDSPYIIDENNVDRYPLVKPFKFKVSGLFVFPKVLSGSSLGVVRVSTFNGSSPLIGSIGKLIAVPEGVKARILCEGKLYDAYTNERLEGREVKLLVDGRLISSAVTAGEGANVNLSAILELPYGMHDAEVVFEGDDEYAPSSRQFKIIAYRSSGFNITRDAYRFNNWGFTFDEFLRLGQKLVEEGLLEAPLRAPFLMLFPLLSWGGHCFGMAASSSAYYLAPYLKPKPTDVYEMSKDDVLWDINWYHLIQVEWRFAEEKNIDLALNDVKSLIDSGTPVLLVLRDPINHAITITGYCEQEGKTFLIIYDNNGANFTIALDVVDGKLMYYWYKNVLNVSKALFIDPNYPLSLSFEARLNFLKETLKEIFKEFFGVIVHSPVDIKITSESGKMLLIENNTIARNDFPAGYFHITPEEKIILLPSNETYSLEAIGTNQGEMSMECVHTVNDQVLVYQYQNITVIPGTRFNLPTLDSEKASLDAEGDGIVDEEIEANVIPEFPSPTILISSLLLALITIIIAKKKLLQIKT